MTSIFFSKEALNIAKTLFWGPTHFFGQKMVDLYTFLALRVKIAYFLMYHMIAQTNKNTIVYVRAKLPTM